MIYAWLMHSILSTVPCTSTNPSILDKHSSCVLQVGGAWVALYLWGFVLALSIFFMTIYPTVIAPLFNKFETLPEVRSHPNPPPMRPCAYHVGPGMYSHVLI
jgi:hypothetical protein